MLECGLGHSRLDIRLFSLCLVSEEEGSQPLSLQFCFLSCRCARETEAQLSPFHRGGCRGFKRSDGTTVIQPARGICAGLPASHIRGPWAASCPPWVPSRGLLGGRAHLQSLWPRNQQREPSDPEAWAGGANAGQVSVLPSGPSVSLIQGEDGSGKLNADDPMIPICC